MTQLKYYDATANGGAGAWVTAVVGAQGPQGAQGSGAAGTLLAANNLNDVANTTTSLANLGGLPLAGGTMTGPIIGFQDKGSQVFNVKAYGAKGDGTTDDSAAIQATINAAAVVHGITYFPPTGNYYKCSSGLTGGDYTYLQGPSFALGNVRSIARLRFDSTVAVGFVAGVNNTIENLGFDGGGRSYSNTGITSNTHLRMRNAQIVGFGVGWWATNAYYSQTYSTEIHYCHIGIAVTDSYNFNHYGIKLSTNNIGVDFLSPTQPTNLFGGSIEAYGPSTSAKASFTGISSNGSVWTITGTTFPYLPGQQVTISNTTNYNGTFTVASQISPTSFTITNTNSFASESAGFIVQAFGGIVIEPNAQSSTVNLDGVYFESSVGGTISSISSSGGTWTVVTNYTGSFLAQQTIVISGTTNYNGTFQVASGPSAGTFTIVGQTNYATETAGIAYTNGVGVAGLGGFRSVINLKGVYAILTNSASFCDVSITTGQATSTANINSLGNRFQCAAASATSVTAPAVFMFAGTVATNPTQWTAFNDNIQNLAAGTYTNLSGVTTNTGYLLANGFKGPKTDSTGLSLDQRGGKSSAYVQMGAGLQVQAVTSLSPTNDAVSVVGKTGNTTGRAVVTYNASSTKSGGGLGFDGSVQVQLGSTFFSGSGAPTLSATSGDFYFRTDTPSVVTQRIYVCTGGTSWTGII